MRETGAARTALAAFLFTACAAWAQAPSTAEPSRAELLFWETIRNSTNPADFEEYLRQYPNGTFAGLARNRLKGPPAAAPAVARAAEAAPLKAVELPKAGATWKYRYVDRKFSRVRHDFSVSVASVGGAVVTEVLAVSGAEGKPMQVGAKDLHFTVRDLPLDRKLVEFTPYLASREDKPPSRTRFRAGTGYPVDTYGDWQVTLMNLPEAPITVGSGTFQATRVELRGTRAIGQDISRRNVPARFQVTVWYVPEIKRYARLEHKVWTAGSALAGDEVVDLIEYSGL